mgnify:CR=1 FL=1|tara:strand:+ start:175 stop:411 length:237 start_codon:yes stop_codon:yes gene_type:complete
MTQVYSDPSKASDEWSIPDAEVFHSSDYGHDLELDENRERAFPSGFYYWYCLPGCLPDSSPIGPFETEAEAIEALRNE